MIYFFIYHLLISEDHYGRQREVVHGNGLDSYAEAAGPRFNRRIVNTYDKGIEVNSFKQLQIPPSVLNRNLVNIYDEARYI